MKTFQSTIKLLVFGLLLATVLYNCKTKDVDSLTPFTYTFPGITEKLPDVTPTAPAAVSATASSVNNSTAAAAVSTGLASISATGQVPPTVTQAANDVAKVVSPEQASTLVAAFTPDVVNSLTATGTLPANLKAEAAAIANNPAVAAYMPTFTLPTVDGKPVGGRIGAAGPVIDAVSVVYSTLDDDACKAAANKAFNEAVASLNATKTTQTAAITAEYTRLQTTIQADATACKSGISATYAGYRVLVTQQINQALAAVNAAKSFLPAASYNLLIVLIYAELVRYLDILTSGQLADSAACDAVAAKKLANAQAARDKDLSKINDNYNKAVENLTKARDKAVAACHNQGNGG